MSHKGLLEHIELHHRRRDGDYAFDENISLYQEGVTTLWELIHLHIVNHKDASPVDRWVFPDGHTHSWMRL